MKIDGQIAIVTGGASGLGAETAHQLALAGAKVAIFDLEHKFSDAQKLAAKINGLALVCDITDSDSISTAIQATSEQLGGARILVNCAGIAGAKRVLGRDNAVVPLDHFSQIIDVNLVGTFNIIRLFARQAANLPELADSERGVIINTASVAAYDGQIGQAAYAASKGGLVSLTLPLARDLAQSGIRVMTIAPGLFLTPLLAELPPEVQQTLAESIPFPKRLGKATEFADLVKHIVENPSLNGETIRLDGALRLPPR